MTSAMAAFGIAVGAASLLCYVLMTRLQNRRANRKSQSDSPSADGGNYAWSDGWSMSSWFGGVHSAFDSSGNPSDSGGSDSGRGGDRRRRLTLRAPLTSSSVLIYCHMSF
jgi:hypothetical protein